MSVRRPPGTLAAAALIARKDLAIEFRTRSAFLAALTFSLIAIVIFFFAWDATAVGAVDLAPGVLWVIFTFSGLLGLHRSFGVEEADRAIDALLASPVDREAVFLGKALANLDRRGVMAQSDAEDFHASKVRLLGNESEPRERRQNDRECADGKPSRAPGADPAPRFSAG